MELRKAAAAWTYLSEANDEASALLCRILGEDKALEWVKSCADKTDPRQPIGTKTVPPIDPSRYPGVEKISSQRWKNRLKTWLPRLNELKLDQLLKASEKLKIKLITRHDPQWPGQLENMPAPPVALWLWGNPDLLDPQIHLQVAVVGSRANSTRGMNVTADLVQGCKKTNLVVVSGAAWGIDAIAHRAALASDIPTVAVLAGGLDHLYPAAHHQLIKEIGQKHLVVTQYPVGFRPSRWRFLDRNQLMAGLCQAVVVVEAGIRSGSLNTARHAGDLGKHIGVVPGPVDEMTWLGSNQLLRDGATVIRNSDDLLEMVLPLGSVESWQGDKPVGILDGLSAHEARVLDALPKQSGTTVEKLTPISGLSIEQVTSALGSLLLEGKVTQMANLWKRT